MKMHDWQLGRMAVLYCPKYHNFDPFDVSINSYLTFCQSSLEHDIKCFIKGCKLLNPLLLTPNSRFALLFTNLPKVQVYKAISF